MGCVTVGLHFCLVFGHWSLHCCLVLSTDHSLACHGLAFSVLLAFTSYCISLHFYPPLWLYGYIFVVVLLFGPPCEPCLSLSCLLCSDLIFACFTSRAQRGVTSTKKCSHTSPHCPHVHQSFTTSGALQSEAAHRHLLGTMQVIPILSVLVIVIIVARSLGTRHFCSDLRKICTNNPHPQVKQSFGPKIIGAQKWRGGAEKL